MPNKESHSLRNTIIASVVSGIILAAITPVRDFCVKIFAWLWSSIPWIWKFLISSYSIPGWILLIISSLAFVEAIKIFRIFRPKNLPEYLSCTEDIIDDVKWRWSWINGAISNLWCFCPHCDAELVYDESPYRLFRSEIPRTYFICERCNNQVVASISGGDKTDAIGAIQREIRRRVRTNQYKKVQPL